MPEPDLVRPSGRSGQPFALVILRSVVSTYCTGAKTTLLDLGRSSACTLAGQNNSAQLPAYRCRRIDA